MLTLKKKSLLTYPQQQWGSLIKDLSLCILMQPALRDTG